MKDEDYQVISSETVFQGKILNVKVDRISYPHGEVLAREVVHHPGAVGIVGLADTNEVFLVKQFRPPIGGQVLEIPAGLLQDGEGPAECAVREFEEETGMKAGRVEKLASFYSSPGYSDEFLHLYLAENLTKSRVDPDEDEFLEIIRLNLPRAIELIGSGEILDAKTIVGLLLVRERFGR